MGLATEGAICVVGRCSESSRTGSTFRFLRSVRLAAHPACYALEGGVWGWLPSGRSASLGGARNPHVREIRSGRSAPLRAVRLAAHPARYALEGGGGGSRGQAALRLTIFFVFETLAHQKPFGLSLSKPYGKSHSTFCGEDVFLEVRTPFSVRAEPVEASRLRLRLATCVTD